MFSGESRDTVTDVVVHHVHTGPVVAAGYTKTIIYVLKEIHAMIVYQEVIDNILSFNYKLGSYDENLGCRFPHTTFYPIQSQQFQSQSNYIKYIFNCYIYEFMQIDTNDTNKCTQCRLV